MAVKIKRNLNRLALLLKTRYKKRLRLGVSGYSQLFFYSLLFCYPSFSYAGPNLSGVVGGDTAATVHTHGLTTEIHQNLNSVAIDWHSFNINSNEVVNFIQPNSSSIALNQILSSGASDIRGQINANGNIVLVNPNGIFFSETASVNVGGLIASGLNISTSDFLNGDYIFNEVVGSDGFVINSGLINASLGGSVTLLGKQVTNEGVISAQLGGVNLAAGKAAVLTFDQQGLLGVQVTEAILQDELGIDPAVLNSGEINAEGGRVLLTASVSQDVFSQAVNSGGIEQATSVVVNEDGSFTLGSGADVSNTGSVNVSSLSDAGDIVLLGENISNSGSLKADSVFKNGGEIEIQAADTTLLVEASEVSAQSALAGQGGTVKVLADKVGVLDETTINTSGALGGGEVLVGGDFQGKNKNITNANYTLISNDVVISNNAGLVGDAGKTIVWADKDTVFQGQINATGGRLFGNGGFIEVSGKERLNFEGRTDRSAFNGQSGLLLLDPRDITVTSNFSDSSSDNALLTNSTPVARQIVFTEFVTGSATTDDLSIGIGTLSSELSNGDVLLQAYDDIFISQAFSANSGNTNNLTLQAGNGVVVGANINLRAGDISIIAGSAECGGTCSSDDFSDIIINSTIETTAAINLFAADTVFINASVGNASTGASSVTVRAGTAIDVSSGGITTNNGLVSLTASDASLVTDSIASAVRRTDDAAITIQANVSTKGGDFTATTTTGYFDNDFSNNAGIISTIGGDITISTGGTAGGGYGAWLGGLSTTGLLSVTTTGGNIRQISLSNIGSRPSNSINVNNATFNANSDNITLERSDNNFTGTVEINGGTVSITDTNAIALGATTVTNGLTLLAGGAITQSNTTGEALDITGTALFSAGSNTITLENTENDFKGNVDVNNTGNNAINIVDANNILIGDISIQGGTYTVTAGEDITLNQALDVNGFGTGSAISFNAVDDVFVANSISDSSLSSLDGLSVTLNSDTDNDTFGIVNIDANVNTYGAGFTVTNAAGFDSTGFTVNTAAIDDNTESVAASGSISITTTNNILTGGTARGLLIAGALNSSAGTSAEDATPFTAGSITLNGNGDVNLLSTVSSIGGHSGKDNDNDGSGIDGRNGGAINITSTTGNVSVSSSSVINSSGGNNNQRDDTDGATGGQAGVINLIATTSGKEILLGSNLIAAGGQRYDDTSLVTYGTLGQGNDITLNGAVRLTNNIEITSFVNNSSDSATLSGINSANVGEITFTNTVDAALAFNESLTLISDSADISFNGTTGIGSIVTLGDLIINPAGTVVFAGNIIAKSVDVQNSTNVNATGIKITTTGEDGADAGAISLIASDSITIGDLDLIGGVASGTSAGFAGGNLTLNAEDVTAGAINTYGSAASSSGIGGIGGDVLINELTVITATGKGIINLGNIDTHGGASVGENSGVNAGQIAIQGNVITLADIISTGGIAGASASVALNGGDAGAVSIIATDIDNVATVNLNGDFDTQGGSANGGAGGGVDGTAQTAAIDIEGDNNTVGSVNVTYVPASAVITTPGFTSNVILTDNSTGSTTLTAAARPNAWAVDNANDGTLNNNISFVDFENLTGNTDVDQFTFGLVGSVINVVGGGGNNTITGRNATNSWTLGLANAGSVTDNDATQTYITSFTDIQIINGGSGTDTLTGRTTNSTWAIDNPNAGSVAESIVSPTDTISFTGVENLVGNDAADDDFVFSNSGTLTGTITGGTGTDTVTLNIVDGGLNTWNITGPDSGRLVGVINTSDATNLEDGFTGIEGVKGSDDDDNFVIENVNYIAAIHGGDNTTTDLNDTVDFNGFGAGAFNLDVQLGSLGFVNIETINGNTNVGSINTLMGDNNNATNTWNITDTNSGNVNDGIAFTNFNNLTGGDASSDTFNFIDDGVTRGSLDGLIDGGSGGGTDTINIFTPANLSGVGTGQLINVQLEGLGDAAAIANAYLDVNDVDQINANVNFVNELRAGSAGTNTWDVTANQQGTTSNINTNVTFTGFSTLTGADGIADNFSISTTTPLSMTLNGGASDVGTFAEFDTLTGADSDSIWNINTEDSGRLTDTNVTANFDITFNGFENLAGNNSVDQFILNDNLRGTINGGAGAAIDTLTGNNVVTNNWDITNTNEGSVEGIDSANSQAAYGFTGIESLIGNSGIDNFALNGGTLSGTIDGGTGNDTLTGDTGPNTWDITAVDEGNLNGVDNTNSNNTYDFTGIESLIGNTGDDDFSLIGTATLSGTINGGAAGTDSLTANDAVAGNTWSIDSTNQGKVTGVNTGTPLAAFDFTGIDEIIGGSADDSFTFSGTGSMGLVSGGTAGVNTLKGRDIANLWTLSGQNAGTVADNTVPLTPVTYITSFDNIQTIIGGTNSDTLVSSNNANGTTWSLDSLGGGAVSDSTTAALLIDYSAFENLQGGTADDRFIINIATPAGVLSGTINGGAGAGTDSIEFAAGVNDGVTNYWVITSDNSGRLDNSADDIVAIQNVINTSAGTGNGDGFTEIESIVGGSTDADIFALTVDPFIGTINGGNDDNLIDSGDIADFSALGAAFNVQAGANGFTNIDQFIGNNNGTFVGGDEVNFWEIDGENTGTLNGFRYSGFANISGGSAEDTFTFFENGNVTGLIDGGSNSAIDIIRLDPTEAALVAGMDIQLNGVFNDTANNRLDIINIEQIDFTGSVNTNQIFGDNIANNWLISGVNSGFISSTNPLTTTPVANVEGLLQFNNFSVLTGNVLDDQFIINGGTFTGTLNGGAAGNDTINVLTGASNVWNLTANNNGNFNGVTVFTDIETINANGGSLNGPSLVANTWAIDSDFGGTLNTALTFSNIASITGGMQIDNFNIADTVTTGSFSGGAGASFDVISLATETDSIANNWEITGADQGTLKDTGASSIQFSSIESLVGNDGDDNFTLNGGTLSGTITGGASNLNGDTLTVAGTVTNAWVITGANQGRVAGVNTTVPTADGFFGIENLTGNAQDDNFTFSVGSSISGLISGGGELRDAGNILIVSGDVVDMSALEINIDITLGDDFSDIEKIVGNNNGTTETTYQSTLTGANIDSSWRIYNLAFPIVSNTDPKVVNQGTVKDTGDVTGHTTITFSNFNNITGGSANDTFKTESNGDITGTIDGGGGINSLDLSSLELVDRTIDTALSNSGIANITGITGNGDKSILRAGDSGSLWTITANNTGSVDYDDGDGDGTHTLNFFDFNVLQGGDGTDIFNVQNGGSIIDNTAAADTVSRINGGAGDDELNVDLSGTASQVVNLFDGDGAVAATTALSTSFTFNTSALAGTDSVNINSGTGATAFETATYAASYTSDNGSPDVAVPVVHSYSDALNTITSSVSYVRVEDPTADYVQANNLIVNGSGNTNTVTLGDSSAGTGFFVIEDGATVGAGTNSYQVNYQNKGGISVNNLGVTSRIELEGGLDFGTTGLIDLSAATINLQDTNAVITGNRLRLDSVSGINTTDDATRLLTDVTELELNNLTTALFVNETNAANGIDLVQTGITGELNIISDNGDITDSGDLISAAAVNFTATNGNIILDNVNSFSNNISLTTVAGGTATLDNSGSATNLLSVTTGNLNIISGGAISDVGPIVATINSDLNAGASTIVLDNAANDFGMLTISSASAADITDMNSIVFGNVTLGTGGFRVNAVGVSQQFGTAITQVANSSGTAGVLEIDAGDGAIDLTSASNDFVGDVLLRNVGATNNVAITNTKRITFGDSVIGSGTFDVIAQGISQLGNTSITQTADINGAAGAVNLNAGDAAISLGEASNDFIGVVALATNTGSNNVTITDLNNILLGDSTIGGDLMVTAIGTGLPASQPNDLSSGDILQDVNSLAGISVDGSSTFRVNENRSIILDNVNNSFNALSFETSTGAGRINNVMLFNDQMVVLNNIDLAGNLIVFANGDVTNQAGSIKVAGTTWIEASSSSAFNQDPAVSVPTQLFNVNLNNAANDFADLVINAANDVVITDMNGLNFGDSANLMVGVPAVIALRDTTTIDGNLTVNAVNDIADLSNSSLIVTGSANFNSTTGNVVLDDNVNLNVVGFNAQTVSLVNADAINLSTSTINGIASFTANTGDITNSGALSIVGDVDFNAAANSNVTLLNIANGNRLQGGLSFIPASGILNTITLENTTDSNLQFVNASNLIINTTAAVDDTATASLTVANNTTLNSGGQSIIFDGAANDFNNLSVSNTGSLLINDINAINITDIAVVGETNITSVGLLASGDINSGSIIFDATTGDASFNVLTANNNGIDIRARNITQSGVITSQNDVNLNAAETINFNAVSTVVQGGLFASADQVIQINNDINTALNIDLSTLNGGISQNANLTSSQGDIVLNSGMNILMAAASSTTSTAGNITLNAVENINVSLLDAENGDISLVTTNGAVINNAPSSVSPNFIADRLIIESVSGIGVANAIDTQVQVMDIVNTNLGDINIFQNGDVDIMRLRNEFSATSVGSRDIDIFVTGDIYVAPNSVYVDRMTGGLRMETTGDFKGIESDVIGVVPGLDNPDITANQASFFVFDGTFGTADRLIYLDVDTSGSVFIDSLTTAFLIGPGEPTVDSNGLDISALGIGAALAGELLVEVESLGDVDPAIFTDLQNYSLQDVSIRMPRDQLFEDELDEDARLQ